MAVKESIFFSIYTKLVPTGIQKFTSEMAKAKKMSDRTGISQIALVNSTRRQGFSFNDAGDAMEKVGGKLKKTDRAYNATRRGALRPFRGDLLSLMFIGQGVSAMFKGMIMPVLKLAGVFDVWNATLISVLGPVLFPFAEILIKIMTWFMDLPGPVKKFIGGFVLIGAIVGGVIALLAPFGILLATLGVQFGFIAVAKVAFTVVGAAMFVLWGVFRAFMGFMEGDWWKVISGIFIAVGAVVGAVMFGVSGLWIPMVIGAIVLLADKFLWLKQFIMGIIVILLTPLTFLLDILHNIVSLVAGKGLAGLQLTNKLGGLIPKMAEGGIVRKPTLAMIGEKGPEAVIPLNGSGSGGGSYTFNVSVNNPTIASGLDVDRIARDISSKMYGELRRLGVR